MQQQRLPTPLGPMTALCDSTGLLGLWFDGQKHHPGPLAAATVQTPLFDQVQAALQAYFNRDWHTFEQQLQRLPLSPRGTPFQRAVWQVLRNIPLGQCLSYGALATALGRPQAARAVGAAVGRNPISLLIPCHRVIGSQGDLTGYAGGLERKTALLQQEQASTESWV